MLHPHRPATADHILRPKIVCTPEPPCVGSRWAPGSILRRDTAAGTFEHINPRDFGNDALYLQQALIYDDVCQPRRLSWHGVFLLSVVVIVVMTLLRTAL